MHLFAARYPVRAIAYWVVTGVVALFMVKSAHAYLTQEAVRVECQRLGFPDWFRVELAVAKTLGALALLVPVGPRLKEWAYAGFVILLLSATLAHIESGEPAVSTTGALGLLGLLAVSYGLRPTVVRTLVAHGQTRQAARSLPSSPGCGL